MFQREIDLAASCGELMRRHLHATAKATHIKDVSSHLESALEAAWRMESALGEFLAVEEHKLRATEMVETAKSAREAFDALKPSLADADEARLRDDIEMKRWVGRFMPHAERAVHSALEARRKMPRLASHRISTPVGQASPESARAVVSIARTERENLTVGDVASLVRQALEPLGGIGRFVQPGQTVLLKPNQTLFMLASEGSTTDPRVVAAVARICFEAGAGRVIVGESSGGGSRTIEVMHVTGVKMMAQREGAEIADFQTCEQREVDVNGKVIKRILLPVPLLDADVVINLPKMKTHNWDWISGALKNWVGVVRPDVRSAHHDAKTYDEYIDLFFRAPAQLNIMDAIIRGVGNGPGANHGEFYGAILASTDPVAMDAVDAQILGFNPASIGFIQAASERGLGTGDPYQIAVVGYPLEKAFKPGTPPEMGVDFYDANVIVGTRLTRAGTLGHLKSMGDIFQAMGTWMVVKRIHGKATLLVGDAEDPLFSKHLKEGPYVVIDDAAPEKYKHHPDVLFIPGHPVLHNLESLLPVGLRVPRLGHLAMNIMGQTRTLDSRLEFDSPQPVVPLVRAALTASRALTVPFQVALTLGTMGALMLTLGLGFARLLRRP